MYKRRENMLNRLLPAANAAALVAAVVHVFLLAVITGSLSIESTVIALMTYVIVVVVAIPFGVILLSVVGFFKIGLVLSLVLFQAAALMAVAMITMYLFEFKPAEIPWRYAYISAPSAITAWVFSVYHSWRKDRSSP